MWIKANRNKRLKKIMVTVNRKLIGHYNYYGITDNCESLSRILFEISKLLLNVKQKKLEKGL